MSRRKRLGLDYRPLSELRAFPRNPKEHEAEEIGQAQRRWGYSDPILVDERSGFIAHGHGRLEALEALKAAGQDPPAFVDKRSDGEWLVPVLKNWQSASDAELDAYVIAHNRLTEKGGWDDQALAKLAGEILAAGSPLEGVGFDHGELAALAKDLKTEDDFEGTRPTDVWADDPAHKLKRSRPAIVIGGYRVNVDRERYDTWIDGIRQKVGLETEAILGEIRRRLRL